MSAQVCPCQGSGLQPANKVVGLDGVRCCAGGNLNTLLQPFSISINPDTAHERSAGSVPHPAVVLASAHLSSSMDGPQPEPDISVRRNMHWHALPSWHPSNGCCVLQLTRTQACASLHRAGA